jgi:hypothetical protein
MMGPRATATAATISVIDVVIQAVEAQIQELAQAPATSGDVLSDVDAIGALEMRRLVLERRKQMP